MSIAALRFVLVGSVALSACGSADRPPDSLTKADQRQTIAAVIESDVLTLLDTVKIRTPVTWRDWWYTVIDNVDHPSPAVIDRFREAGFNMRNPPPRPRNDVDHVYQIRRAHFLDESTLEADIGPSFLGCTYRLRHRNDHWMVVSKDPEHCWIS